MRILLLNPPAEFSAKEFANEKGREFIEIKHFGYFPPTGLLYIHSYLSENSPGHELFLHDCVAERKSQKDIKKIIQSIRPDLVGMSSFTLSLYDVFLTAKTIKTISPHTHICLGGHFAMAFPFESAQLENIDSVVIGEGEKIFAELVARLQAGNQIETLPGVLTKNNCGSIDPTIDPARGILKRPIMEIGLIEDLDCLPFPNRNIIRHIDYKSIVGASNRLATMITSRGCPYQCTFCEMPYKKFRTRSMDNIADEIESILALGYREIHFYDDLFNYTTSRLEEISEQILNRNFRFCWSFRGVVAGISQRSLKLAKRAGLRMVTFGVETGSDENLITIKKNTDVGKIRKAFRTCRDQGIQTIADFMIGFPFETSEMEVQRNVDFLFDLDPTYAQFGVLALFPHTEIFDDAVKRGFIDLSRWQDFVIRPKPGFKVDHWVEHLSLADLARLQRRCYKRFYFRLGYILRSALKTRSLHELVSKTTGAIRILTVGR